MMVKISFSYTSGLGTRERGGGGAEAEVVGKLPTYSVKNSLFFTKPF
jgi:hypothetical protein